MRSEETAPVTSNSALLSKERDSRRAIGMLGLEYLLKCPELPVTAKDQREGQTDFLEMIWPQWEMTSRDSTSDSATQVARICRHYLPWLKCVCVISLIFLWIRKRFRELKWLVESHRARRLQKWNARAVLSRAANHWHSCYLTIVPSGMQNLSLSRLADAESASLMQSADDAYAHATEWHCCGCYSLLCMESPAEAETKDCRSTPNNYISDPGSGAGVFFFFSQAFSDG